MENNTNIDSIVRFKKDNNWFNWRYFDNPLNHYKVFYVNAGKIGTGIIVTKYFHENSLVIGHIVDIIISEQAESLVKQKTTSTGIHVVLIDEEESVLVPLDGVISVEENKDTKLAVVENIVSKNAPP